MIMTKARALLESETQAAEANAMLNRPTMPTPTPLERRFSFPDGSGFPSVARQMSFPQGSGPLQSMPIPNLQHESPHMQMGQAPGFNVTPTSLSSFDYDSYCLDGQVPQKDVLESIRAEKVAKNPMLASLLDQDNDSPEGQATLLPNLLADNPHNQPTLPKPRKPRKRKATSDARSPGSSSGKSPKRKFSEEDYAGYNRQMSQDLPSLPMIGSVESNDPFELPMHDMQQMKASVSQLSTPTTPIDQPLYHTESHVTKLASSLDNIIKQETKNLPSCQQGELAALLSDNIEDNEKPQKKSDVPHPPKAVDTPAVVPSTSTHLSGADTAIIINIADIQSKNDPLATTLDDIINNVASGTTPLDPEIFTNKEGMVFVGGELVGQEAALRPETSSAEEATGIVQQSSFPSQDFDTDPLEFNTELLNTEGTFTENENSEEMDLEACDANAFGVTLNPTVVASKLTASGSTPPTQTSQNTITTAASSTSTASTPPTTAATTTASVMPTSNAEVKAVTPVEKKPEKEKKEHKEKEKLKEKKDNNSKDEKSKKVTPKPPILTMKIGCETTHMPSPQDALDLSASKEQKIMKSKLTKQSATEVEEEHSDRPTYTSASTGCGTSIVISTKSSPALSSSGSSSASSSAKIISSKDNLLKVSVKKDKLKKPKESKEDDLKRKKDGTKKDKYSKKRKLDDNVKTTSDSSFQVKDSSSSKSKSEHKPSTKIKITTTGGRMHVQPANKTPPATDSSSKSKSLTPQKTSPSLKPVKSGEKNPPLQLKLPSSKIAAHGSSSKVTKKYTTAQNITVSKGDSKLMTKTPTIKLKPLRMPSSASSSTFTLSTKNTTPTTSTTTKSSAPSGLQKSMSTSSKFYGQKTPTTPPLSKISSSSVSPATKYVSSSTTNSAKPSTPVTPTTPTTSTPSTPTQATSSSGTPPVGSLGKGKSPMRSRSLSAVIDKLTKTQSQTSIGVPGSGDSPSKSSEKKEGSVPLKSSVKRDDDKSKSDSHREISNSGSQKERLKPNILSKSFSVSNPLKRPETAKLDISKLPKIPKIDPNKKKDLTPTTTKSVLPVPPKPSTLSSTGVGNNNSSGGQKSSHGNSDKMASNSDKQKSESFHSGEKSRTAFEQVKKVSSIPSQKSSMTSSSNSEKFSESKPSDPRLADPRLALPDLKSKDKETPQPEANNSKITQKEEPKEPEKPAEKLPSGRSTSDSRTHGRSTPDGRGTPDNGLKDKIVKDNNNRTQTTPINEKDTINDLENAAKQIFGEKSDYFKQPTPKSNKTLVEPKPRVERTGPVQSPRSSPSSPEDSLFIDCPGTPGSRESGRSPVSSAPVTGTKSPALPAERRYSPVPPKSPGLHDSPLVKKSPLTQSPMAVSPKVLAKPITSPISNPSPCMIDDDLMDEAVMGLGD
jgi:hypothetical protein